MASSVPAPPGFGPYDHVEEDAARVVSKAFVRAAGLLDLSQADQGRMLGLSAASMSRLHRGQRVIDPNEKEGELALLFLRVLRSLSGLLGGNGDQMRTWFNSENKHLDGTPAELCKSVTGLAAVAHYLDALRGAP